MHGRPLALTRLSGLPRSQEAAENWASPYPPQIKAIGYFCYQRPLTQAIHVGFILRIGGDLRRRLADR